MPNYLVITRMPQSRDAAQGQKGEVFLADSYDDALDLYLESHRRVITRTSSKLSDVAQYFPREIKVFELDEGVEFDIEKPKLAIGFSKKPK